MKNANKAETSKETKALTVVAKAEKKLRAKRKPNAATVETANELSSDTVGLDVGDRVSQFCRLDASASIPFVKQGGPRTELFQSFVVDPQDAANISQFRPNFRQFPLGADLRSIGKSLPFDHSGVDV